MGLFNTIVGGTIGFMVAGPLGAAGGALLANSFTDDGVKNDNKIEVICPYCNGDVVVEGPGTWSCPYCQRDFNYGNCEEQDEENFNYLLFALFAKFAKADGSISKQHIKVLEELMENEYNYDKEMKKYAIEAFRKAKDSENGFEYYCFKINNMVKNHDDIEVAHNVFCGTIDSLYKIALADNEVSNEKERLINLAVNIFKMEKHIFEDIRNNYVDQNIKKYYEILGCVKGDSLDIIKSKYRKLASEYHPDRILSKNLPDYLVKYSNEKFREINEAYEYIKDKILV